MKYKLGDRVKAKGRAHLVGCKEGTIIALPITADSSFYGIEFDEMFDLGHNCKGIGKKGYCWYLSKALFDPLPQPYFADVRVGDTVYDMAYGEGVIMGIDKRGFYNGLLVNFPNLPGYTSYTLNGEFAVKEPQRLFYSKPIFELPPPPKRKVKKVIEGWVNIYPETTSNYVGAIHATEGQADNQQRTGSFPSRLGKAVFIHHEYEVGE